MKRSEAVELLAKRLFLKVDDITLHDSSSLMFFIEERLGMLPPARQVPHCSGEDCYKYAEANEWEPEERKETDHK